VPSATGPTIRRELRRDARANRERIVRAADEAFAEHGLEASVEEIARRAGVGMGTLYRRFPNKAALVDAVFEGHLEDLALIAEGALGEHDAWQGLSHFLEQVVARQASNRGFAEIVAVHVRNESRLAKARARLRPLLRRLIDRARAAGALRSDIVYEDISVLLWTSARVVDATREIAPEFWRRHLRLALDGLRELEASPLPHPPLTAAQHSEAMERLARQLHLEPLPVERALPGRSRP
jgi:AcrR family transcriptional regulator